MTTLPCIRFTATRAFTFVEAIFTIAIIGIMSALALSAISNGARDANRIVARQQQAALQEAVNAWVMNQMRQTVIDSTGRQVAQLRSLNSVRASYNSLTTTSARFNLLVPNAASTDPNARNGYIDRSTADHFFEYTSSTDRLYTAALKGVKMHLTLPMWQFESYPTVEMVADPQ
jgi:type II secretory pathway pseudopilin PulG